VKAFLCGLLMTLCVESTLSAQEPIKTSLSSDTVEFILLDEVKIAKIRIQATSEGKPLSTVRDKAFARLLQQYDRSGDGLLSREEARLLPSAYNLRQLLWGRSNPYTGLPIPWEKLDPQQLGKIGVGDLAHYYQSQGVGTISFALTTSAASPLLSDVLVKLLDADKNGQLSEAEWNLAFDKLKPLDRNGDELITSPELISQSIYPGHTGFNLLLPPKEGTKTQVSPIVLLPQSFADTNWVSEILRRRDRDGNGTLLLSESGLTQEVFERLDQNKDGSLNATEIARWRSLDPLETWNVEIGKWPDRLPTLSHQNKVIPQIESQVAGTKILLRRDRGQLHASLANARKRIQDQFSDANREGYIEAADVTKRSLYELQQLLAVADLNANKRLELSEVESWLQTQETLATAQVLISVCDHGRGLFELVDANHDGAISRSELEGAYSHIKSSESILDGKPILPHHLMAVVSRGYPQNLLGHVERNGPAWFVAMDRNGDGEISAAEFTGPTDLFKQLDQDQNGRLSMQEVERIKRP
jgi:hypothetical protein